MSKIENKCSAILIAKTITKQKTCKRRRRRDSGGKEQRDVSESCAKNTKRKPTATDGQWHTMSKRDGWSLNEKHIN